MHVKIGATELELQEFNLWELRVKHDMEQFLSWSKVMQDRDTQTYYKQIQHNILRAAECGAAAKSLLDPSHKNCVVRLVPRTDEHIFLAAVADAK